MINVIPGMPICGQCPDCKGAMHFHYEVQNKKCRFCGPGSSKDASRQLQMHVTAPPNGGAPVISHDANQAALPAPTDQRAFPPPPSNNPAPPAANGSNAPNANDPYAALMAQNGPSKTVVTKTEKGPIDPNIIAAQLKMFGADGQCPFCFLSTRGFNVDVEVVGHSPECQDGKTVPPSQAS